MKAVREDMHATLFFLVNHPFHSFYTFNYIIYASETYMCACTKL